MARVNVVLRRHQSSTPPHTEALHFGGLAIDVAGHTVTLDGQPTELTAKEYALLLYLAENAGIALSRAQILDNVWGYEYTAEDRTVDWQIKLLRSKLGRYRSCVVTLRGMGYKFDASQADA